jgi:hypothetical protein
LLERSLTVTGHHSLRPAAATAPPGRAHPLLGPHPREHFFASAIPASAPPGETRPISTALKKRRRRGRFVRPAALTAGSGVTEARRAAGACFSRSGAGFVVRACVVPCSRRSDFDWDPCLNISVVLLPLFIRLLNILPYIVANPVFVFTEHWNHVS